MLSMKCPCRSSMLDESTQRNVFSFTPISISALVIGDGSYGSPHRAAKPVPQVEGRGFPLLSVIKK